MTTEFKALDEMTEDELMFERCQTWVVTKSTHSWWLFRNQSPFMPVGTEANGIAVLERYGIQVYGVDRSQRPQTAADFADFRRDKMRVLAGSGPSLGRRVWRWLGGDAA